MLQSGNGRRLRNLAPHLNTTLGAAGRWLADFVIPPVCLACRVPLGSRDALCAPCWRQVNFIRHPLCDRLGLPLPYDTGGRMLSAAGAASPPVYGRARAVAHFDGVVRRLVHEFKYADRQDARRLFGRWLVDCAAELIDDADIIVPVPLSRRRLLARRYNQAALLANELSHLTGLPVNPLVLERLRHTSPQVGLTHNQRRRNVAGAFAMADVHGAAVRGRNVLLVDDVITTGATVEASARALQQAGAARVDVVAIALVVNSHAPAN